MTALAADRNTPAVMGDLRRGDAAASVLIYAGALVMRDASGNITKGATATGAIGVGRAEERVDIPRVVGRMKVFPPLASEPLIYFDGADEIVEAAFVLAGPHEIRDIRVGSASIDTLSGVEYEVREGWPGDGQITMLRRQSRTEPLQAELRAHQVGDDGRTLDSQTGDTDIALPQAVAFATKDAPDEHLLQLVLTGGLHRNGDPDIDLRIPFRLRMRLAGSADWIHLPELHFEGADVRQMRATIALVWRDDASATPAAAPAEGWAHARVVSPGQTAAPVSDDWSADPYFVGTGDAWMEAGNLGTTGVLHLSMTRYEARILLDTAIFPKGRYEIEIRRGATYRRSTYSPAGYTIDGTIWNFWGVLGTPGEIVYSRTSVMDTVYLARSVSIWNEHPLPSADLAIIAVRARNRDLESLSCLAGGYVRDWDGTAWAAWTVSDNPATNLREIWTGAQNLDPVPEEILDEDELVDWRAACIASGYRCNAILSGQTVLEAAEIVAGCGYAKPRMSERWGVAIDRDRSAEAPVQIFTPRNSRNFQWTKAFPRLPDGFRVTYPDASRDYDNRQITVSRSGRSGESGLLEQVTYQGLVTEEEVRRRADYDLAQAEARGVYYTLDAPAEAVVCRRGDLVGVQHDMLTAQAGVGRLVAKTLSGSAVSRIRLDTEVPVSNEPDLLAQADVLVVPDLLALGRRTGAAIRRRSGAVTVHPVANTTSEETAILTFSPPISANGIGEDVLVAVGDLGQEMLRLIVFGVAPQDNMEASLTLVDEGQELWA
ncbi:phage tail protein [Cereibacter johrii]|uniref:phage tail protein n=1 Tax=Cereibacter johrii TaxID=445629 RepID=UPI002B26177F|nr:phage tail protein [Cereibacter johrii]MEA5160545.1 phage tail protein [Cereibacter johrii]